jgi:hypothetical protein
VAAGIGGRSVAEAKLSIDLQELRLWSEYRARGFLLTARTVDTAACVVARAFAGGKLENYSRIANITPEVAPVTDWQSAMAIMGGTIKKRGNVQ